MNKAIHVLPPFKTEASRAAAKPAAIVIFGSMLAGISLVLAAGAVLLSFTARGQDVPFPATAETLHLLSQAARDGSTAPVTAAPSHQGRTPALRSNGIPDSTALPGWNNPPAWGAVTGTYQTSTLPGVDRGQLIQPYGRGWRAFHNGPVNHLGGWVMALASAAIAALYLAVGPIGLQGQPTGRLIERFAPIERASHWIVAGAFICQAISGIVILWGKYLVLPLVGHAAFSWLAVLSKTLHNFTGPIFIVALAVLAVFFMKDNLPRSHDLKWFAGLWRIAQGRSEPPSGRFNAGEKLWYWGGVVLLGTAVSITGVILDFPNWDEQRTVLQFSALVHASSAVLFMGAALGHIYLGTVGMKGAYRSMRDGYVDETWAREHHALWFEDIQ